MWTLFLLLLWTSRLQRVVLLVQIVDAGCGWPALRGVSERTTSGPRHWLLTCAPLWQCRGWSWWLYPAGVRAYLERRIAEKGEFEVSLDLLRKNRLDRWAGKSFQSGRARTDQLWTLRSNGNRGNSKHMNNVGLAYVLKCVLHFDLCERLRTMASFVVF